MAEEKQVETKKNKDGLVGGELVSIQDHARILREKNKKKAKAQAAGK